MTLDEIVLKCLPEQGCVEIQRDAPGKEHAWHRHDTDETIVVLDGSLQFFWEHGEAVCERGDVIRLPRGTPHGSRATGSAATYLISFHDARISA